MPSDAGMDPYRVAYVCGGPERVAMVALIALYEEGQIKISPVRRRVRAVRRTPDDPIQAAALEVIPDAGKILGPTMRAIANSTAVRDIGGTLRAERLLPHSRVSALWQWGRVRAGRNLRRGLIGAPGRHGLHRVAAMGAPGIANDAIRRAFETPDPPPPVKLSRTRRDSPLDPGHSTRTPDRAVESGGAVEGI